jgi:hypothetical protein
MFITTFRSRSSASSSSMKTPVPGDVLAPPGGVQVVHASLDPGASVAATDVELGIAPHVAPLAVVAGSTNRKGRPGQHDTGCSLAAS